jgi:hypothetical protein
MPVPPRHGAQDRVEAADADSLRRAGTSEAFAAGLKNPEMTAAAERVIAAPH